jgi:regulator of nonsense transcripts 1
MEAFNTMGNHMVSNSTFEINASDDISTVDRDESILSLAKGPRRRQHDDDESDGIEDDDLESLASHAIDGQKAVVKPEQEQQVEVEKEDKELPPHACAYGHPPFH